MALNTWDHFETIRATFRAVGSTGHRLVIADRAVDVIPFREVESPTGTTRHPPGNRFMNVHGYTDAYLRADVLSPRRPDGPHSQSPNGRRGTEPESGRVRITVGPGVVRLGWTNPVRAEKAAERAVGHHQRDVDDAKLHVRNDLTVTVADDGRAVVSSTRRSPTAADQRGAGGVITEWSRKSRSSMCRAFAELDYSPLVESGRVAAMVTLTYPGDWEAVAPDGASVKRHMVLWRKRFHCEYGEPARYIRKLEFQRRGAPHIHLWMCGAHITGPLGSQLRPAAV
jgi:hypothetical protein